MKLGLSTLVISLVLLICPASTGWAKTNKKGPAPIPSPSATKTSFNIEKNKALKKTGECKEILKACEAAGFKKGAFAKGKGLIKNCLAPILQGNSVRGVSKIDSKLITACKEKHPNFAASGAKPSITKDKFTPQTKLKK